MILVTPSYVPPPGASPSQQPRDPYFSAVRRQAENCPCGQHREYFSRNCDEIRKRCHGRKPQDYRTDECGGRWENGRPAQTQITQQSGGNATITAGDYKLTFDKADKSLLIEGKGCSKKVDWKFYEDPHVRKNGEDIGTIGNDLQIRLDDGTQLKLLMGDGNGGPPRPGAGKFVDTVAVSSPDGTGALVTGISGPGKLGVTPLDSSYASAFLESQAINRFGPYVPSQVFIDRNGTMIDKSNGQIVHDQNGLNRLDQQQVRDEAAYNLYRQGYVPPEFAEQHGRPTHQSDNRLRQPCIDHMSQQLGQLNFMQQAFDGLGMVTLPLARFELSLGLAPFGQRA